jgi:hypothetical protein
MIPCDPIGGYQNFGGMCCLCLQGRSPLGEESDYTVYTGCKGHGGHSDPLKEKRR